MFKTLIAAATLATTSISGLPAFAQSNVRAHQNLWRAVESVGITVHVNTKQYCDPSVTGFKAFGWYNGITRQLVVCQENALNTGRFGQGQLPWTEEDFDTLRHEAHHLVQDCMDSSLNAELSNVYRSPIEFGVGVMGKAKARRVVEMYSERSEHIQVMEIEAFAVAQLTLQPR